MQIHLTSKRQATFPKALCEELGIGPGDKVTLERRTVGGETLWVIRSAKPDWSWLGGAGEYAEGKSHAWEDIEESIERAFATRDDD